MSVHAVHSPMFSQYKNTKEVLLSNYTTNRYMSVLDQLLFSGFVQLLDCSDFLQRPVAALVAWYTLHTKRKVSITDKPEAISNLLQFLINDDGDAKMAAYRRAQIERNVTRSMMEYFAKFVRHYRKLSLAVFRGATSGGQELTHMHSLARQLRLRVEHAAFGLAENLDYWMQLESDFRGLIVQKYIRLILNTANRDCKGYNHRIDINEFVQNYAAAALKAIDKSSVGDMGTLTIYIQGWLKNALLGTVTNFNYGVPYTVPPQKLSEHSHEVVDLDSPAMIGVAIDDSAEDDERDAQIVIRRVRLLAKAVDPVGVGRIALGIDEILSSDELSQLRSIAVK